MLKLAIQDNTDIDLKLGAAGLETDSGLESAVIVSLLTDRRARPDDRLPDDSDKGNGLIPPDRRGWAGDAFAATIDDRIGSRLWLLNREKQTEETRRRAIEYAREALDWLIRDGYAAEIAIEAEWARTGRLEMFVAITLSDGHKFKTTVPNVIGGAHAV